MKETRIAIGIIFLIAGITVLATAKGPQIHQLAQAGLTLFCTGFIMIYCGKN